MKIEDRLSLVKYTPDAASHIKIISLEVCRRCDDKPCLAFCPAAVYSWDESEEAMIIAYEGCFECGACHIACPHRNVDWRFPRGGFGVAFRFG